MPMPYLFSRNISSASISDTEEIVSTRIVVARLHGSQSYDVLRISFSKPLPNLCLRFQLPTKLAVQLDSFWVSLLEPSLPFHHLKDDE